MFAEDYLGKRFPDTGSDAYILMTFDGNSREEVERNYGRAADLCLELGAKDVFLVDTEERRQSVWNARGAFLEAIKASTTEMDECDVVVPRSHVAEFIKYTHELAGTSGMRIPSFGHAGDGNLHIYLCRDDMDQEAWEYKSRMCLKNVRKGQGLRRTCVREHGIGYVSACIWMNSAVRAR